MSDRFVIETEEPVIGPGTGIVTKETLERQKARKKVQLAEQQKKVIDKYIKFCEIFGEEDYRAVMMRNFLDIIIEMNSVIELVESIQEGFDCVFSAMNILDDTFKLFENGLLSTTKEDYGIFSTIKFKRNLKKSIKINVRRMNRFSLMVGSIGGFASTISNSMKRITKKMKKSLSKGKGTGTTSSAVDDLIKKRKEELGKTTPTSTPGSTTTPAPDTTSDDSVFGSGTGGL